MRKNTLVIVTHLSQGWSIADGDALDGIATAINETNPDLQYPNVLAWEVTGAVPDQFRYAFLNGPDTNDYWRLSTTLRIAELNDTLDAGSTVEVGNNTARYILSFGSDATGNTLIKSIVGGFNNIPDHTEPTTLGHTELCYCSDRF